MADNINGSVQKRKHYHYGYVYIDPSGQAPIYTDFVYTKYYRSGDFSLEEEKKQFRTQEDLKKYLGEEGKENARVSYYYVEYVRADYYRYNSQPDANTIKVSVKEQLPDGNWYDRILQFEPEDEEFVCKLFGYFGKISQHAKSHPEIFGSYVDNIDIRNIVSQVDPYKPTRKSLREARERTTVPMAPPKETHWLRRLAVSGILLTILATCGVVIDNSFKNRKEFTTKKNSTLFGTDKYLSDNEEKATEIMDKMMADEYGDISLEDEKFITEYLKKVSDSNFDKNKSSDFFDYSEYFAKKIWEKEEQGKMSRADANKCDSVLKTFQDKIRQCFVVIDGMQFYRKERADSFLNYALSLTFMYDTHVDTRGSGLVPMDIQSYNSPYAPKQDSETFCNLLPVPVKLAMYNDLIAFLKHYTEYQVPKQPTNYFSSELDTFALRNKACTNRDLLQEYIGTLRLEAIKLQNARAGK